MSKDDNQKKHIPEDDTGSEVRGARALMMPAHSRSEGTPEPFDPLDASRPFNDAIEPCLRDSVPAYPCPQDRPQDGTGGVRVPSSGYDLLNATSEVIRMPEPGLDDARDRVVDITGDPV